MYKTLANYNQKLLLGRNISFSSILIALFLGVCWTSCDTIIEDNISNETVVIESPLNGSSLENSNVIFLWEKIDEALTYELRVVDPSFDDVNRIIRVDSVLTGTEFSQSLYLGNFEWRIKAVNGNSETCYTLNSFSIIEEGDISNQSITVTHPTNTSVLSESPVPITWNTLQGAFDYTLKIYDYTNNTQGSLLDEITTENTLYTTNLTDGNYQITIRASDGENQFSQTTSIIFTIDQTAPSAPELIAPNNAILNDGDPISFSWTSGIDALSSTLDSIFVYSVTPDQLVYSGETSTPFELPAEELSVGNYDWQIVTFDKAGNYAASSFFQFEVSE